MSSNIVRIALAAMGGIKEHIKKTWEGKWQLGRL
jgi:hypothetical protein